MSMKPETIQRRAEEHSRRVEKLRAVCLRIITQEAAKKQRGEAAALAKAAESPPPASRSGSRAAPAR